MKVLIGCEKSGIIREAFRKRGHNAYSCDILPGEDNSDKHIVGDVRLALAYGWDLFIVHPECTHLAVSGARYFPEKRADGRQQKAINFFMEMSRANVTKICVENPVGIMSTIWRKPDQIIQPWYYGNDASKATCLWLKNLPLLQDTNRLSGDRNTRRANQTPSGQNKLGPSPTRSADRARTYQGIADAMAEQWGGQ